MKTLGIVICATRAYTREMATQARRVQQCLALSEWRDQPGHVILSGDDSAELRAVVAVYRGLLPDGWKIHHVPSVPTDDAAEVPHKDRDDASEERKRRAFRRIGDMREAAHLLAVRLGVDVCWSLDSDVLPPPNALRASLDALRWDGGYYGVAFCPYPNTLWLGGRGSPDHPIAEDWLPHERALPAWLRAMLERCEQRYKAQPSRRGHELRQRLYERAKAYPPDGNIWEVIAKHGWRQRGWLDFAYPGIGRGAMVPTDWCGFGCTLMSREALSMADFSGYLGHGTEDIWVVRNRWMPAGVRIALLTHCPCDHVYTERIKGETKRTYLRGYHEPEGECAGHLRIEAITLPALPEQEPTPPTLKQAAPRPATWRTELQLEPVMYGVCSGS